MGETINLFDLETGKALQIFSSRSPPEKSAFSPDGKILASGSADKTIKLSDATTGRELRILIGHSSNVSSVAFSPDGKTIVSRGWNETIMWDVETGKGLHILSRGWVSPDGKTRVLGENATIELRDGESFKKLHTLSGH